VVTLADFHKEFWIFICFNLLFLVFSFVFKRQKYNIKKDLNQMNDNLNEMSIQNALDFQAQQKSAEGMYVPPNCVN